MPRCPSCQSPVGTPLKETSPRCAFCGIRLRSHTVAVFLSLALPGLGHWYLRRRSLAVVEMVLGLAIFLAALAHMVIVFLAIVDETRPLGDLLRVVLWWSPAIVGYGVLDALFTWLLSRRRVVLNEDAPSGA